MLLDVREVHSFYGDSHILQGINMRIEEGEIVALMGRNGMGKSTTLKSIVGMVKPRSGSVMFQGKEVSGMPLYRVVREGIGYVPEERRIFPDLSVADNLLLGQKGGEKKKNSHDNPWTLDRIYNHFPRLKERTRQMGRFLSGGEQQMLSIGRSLIGNPRLLLVDEPTEGLAPTMTDEVKKILSQINKAGTTILLVENKLKVTLSLVNRLYVIGKGHIVYEGTAEDFKHNHEIRKNYLEA
ncbi:MAG: ABC transporter ATP-binding protein [Desulfobacteraceae bacterium]|nr:MAG: ABC transporter ATP-binding protein [Desulfobacteraceae bacterium]